MFSIIETVATAILLLILMILLLHLIRGDAVDWVTSKFQIEGLADAINIPSTGTTGTSPSPSGDNA